MGVTTLIVAMGKDNGILEMLSLCCRTLAPAWVRFELYRILQMPAAFVLTFLLKVALAAGAVSAGALQLVWVRC